MSEMDNFVEGFSDATKIAERHYKDKIAELEARLHGTVTTEYHDSIVAEAMQRVSKLEAELAEATDVLHYVFGEPPANGGENGTN